MKADKHAGRTFTFEEINAFQPVRNITIEDTPEIYLGVDTTRSIDQDLRSLMNTGHK